jgi:hypothetical protein
VSVVTMEMMKKKIHVVIPVIVIVPVQME